MKKMNDNKQLNERLCFYSLLHKSEKPLFSIDLLFREINSKLEWMMYSGTLRGAIPLNKDDQSLFDGIEDFIEYRKELLSRVGLDYPFEIIVSSPKLHIGEYYPNIFRPEFSSKLQQKHFVKDASPLLENFDEPAIYNFEEYSDYVRQLDIILNELNNVFKVIAPSKDNLKSYGNSIRNIIVLACTEIDSMMRNVLVRNGYCKDDDFLTMNNYRILNEAMRLNEYSVSLHDYFNLGEFFPFKEWNVPNGSLTWYNAYNNVKHRRIEHFAEANLENAIRAVLGYAVFLVAQYGCENSLWKRKIDDVIKIRKRPQWNLEDFYIPFTTNIEPKAVNYPFPKKEIEKSETRAKLKTINGLLKNKATKADILQSIDELKALVEKDCSDS